MYSLNFILFITGAHSTNSVRMTGGRRQASDAVHSHVIGALELYFNQGGWCKWLRRHFAAQVRTERVSRSLKRVPVPAPVIAAAKRARRAVALFCVTFYS